jgi:hypothetical protein
MSQREIEAMKEIIRKFAEVQSYYYDDNSGVMECMYCTDFYGFGPDVKHTKDHDADCIYRKAVALVAQWEEPTA